VSALAAWLYRLVWSRIAWARDPDLVIGETADPYLHRWYVIPRNRFFNVYLHEFLRSDDDRALHDHPWFWLSFLLRGEYVEHTIAAGGIHRRRRFRAGSMRVHSPWFAHRLEIEPGVACWTLFVTGPRLREWGFHCADFWRHWRDFTDPASRGTRVGKGCTP
jgi:hypothetical protein